MKFKSVIILISINLGVLNLGFSQIKNGNFESWPDSAMFNPNNESFIDSAARERPLEWKHEHEGNTVTVGYYRTTDAVEGKYAAVIYSWYGYLNTMLRQEDTLSIRPTAISGMYKFLLQDDYLDSSDVAKVSVEIFDANDNIIGSGFGNFDTISTYTSFTLPIEYISNEPVFRYKVFFKSSDNGCSIFDGYCKYLFLDDVKFDFVSSLEVTSKKDKIKIYPNPSDGMVHISQPFKNCDLYNLNGQLIHKYHENDRVMLPRQEGIYILRITTNDGEYSIHKVQRAN